MDASPGFHTQGIKCRLQLSKNLSTIERLVMSDSSAFRCSLSRKHSDLSYGLGSE